MISTTQLISDDSVKPALRVAWLAFYPVHLLHSDLDIVTTHKSGHPCSWIVNLAQSLGGRSEVDLHILTLCPWVRKDVTVRRPGGYYLHVIKSGVPFINKGYPAYFPLNALSAYILERRRLCRALSEIRPDVVHAHGTEYAYGLAAMDAAYPWVVSIQGIITEYLRTNPCMLYRLVAPLERLTLKRARFIGGRTHCDKGFAESVNPTARILDLPEAMAPVFYEDPWQDPENQRIVFVGSGEKRKGLRRLIAALGSAASKYPDLKLDVVGRCSEIDRIELGAEAARLGCQIVFHGFMTATEVARIHRECCVFVIPSENENSPNALAEAMASGMPCVAYDTGGIASMLEDGVSGLLVPFGDEGALGASIVKVLGSPELRRKLSANARVQAERNRPERVAQVTLDAYREILAGCR